LSNDLGRDEIFWSASWPDPDYSSNICSFLMMICNQQVVGSNPTAGSLLNRGEEIPWRGKRFIVGTGAHGALPVMDEVLAEAKRRGVEVIAAPTLEVCRLLEEVKKGHAYAILHCTC
jgi:hypothetical protein